MPVPQYGVLVGRASDRRLATKQKNHYEIRIEAAGQSYRIAVNVQSVDKSEVLYFVDPDFFNAFVPQLQALGEGRHPLLSQPNGVAVDYVRGGYVTRDRMKPLPISAPGDDNDLNDKIDGFVQRAMNTDGAVVYAFGSFFKDPPSSKDEYFGFSPAQGIHDVHMNQGNDKKHQGDDGVWQDGALLFHYPSRNQWAAVFLGFQNQSWVTDAQGHATTTTTPEVPGPTPAVAAQLRIVAALANSIENPEIETVTLLNPTPAAVDLSAFALADKNKNHLALSGSLAAGAAVRITVKKPLELSNKGGTITLLDKAGKVIDGVNYTKEQASKPGWSIVF